MTGEDWDTEERDGMVRLADDVTQGPAPSRPTYALRCGIHPSAFGLRPTERACGRLGRRSRATRFALGRYLDALALVLGQDWLTRRAECPVLAYVRDGCHGDPAPCVLINCPHNLVGEVTPKGWPVLYHTTPAQRIEQTCARLAGPETLEEIGQLLGGVTRERVRQLEEHGLQTMRRRLLRRRVVDSPDERRSP